MIKNHEKGEVLKNTGIILDSTTGFTKKEATDMKIGFIPLVITIDGKDYKSGVDISPKFLIKNMKKEMNIHTSSPEPRDIIAAFDYALEHYEKAIYVGMSEKFSSTAALAEKIASNDEKYRNKIFVYKGWYSSPWIGLIKNDLIDLIEKSETIEDVFAKLKEHEKGLVGWLSPGDIFYFYKGGRITKTQYHAANLLKIKPILTVRNGEICQKELIKTRTHDRALKKILEKYYEFINEFKYDTSKMKCLVLEAGDENITNETKNFFIKNIDWVNEKNTIIMPLSAEQTAHMGPNGFGVTFFMPLKEI